MSVDDSGLFRGASLSAIGLNSAAGGSYVLDRLCSFRRLWHIAPNLWAVQSASGSVSVNYTGKGMVTILTRIYNIKGDFGGYPEILYGRKPFGANPPRANGQYMVFPKKVNEISRLDCSVDYSLRISKMGGNIAYDLWLTNEALASSPNGGVEVMVWLWRRNQVPLGSYVGSALFLVNNWPMRFRVYVGKASGWDVVSVLLDDGQVIQNGIVNLNLMDFVRHGLQRLGIRGGEMYLQGVEFGTEFTRADQLFEFTLRRFGIRQTV